MGNGKTEVPGSDDKSKELELAKAEAETQKAIAEAQLQTAEAQQKQFSALLPDLSKVTAGSIETEEGAAFGTSLAQRAVAAAAGAVAKRVLDKIPAGSQILITGDVELASTDAIYVEVVNGLDQLVEASEGLLKQISPGKHVTHLHPGSWGIVGPFSAAFGPVSAAIGAVAAFLPGALSLLSAHRSLATSAVSVDSLAAAASVAEHLLKGKTPPTVFHDDFRLLPEGGVVRKKLTELGEKRQELIDRRAGLEGEKAADGASKELVAECAAHVAAIDTMVTAIDKFTTSLQSTAEGAKHSPLAAAILREQLHATDSSRFGHVLFVKAEAGSAQQLVNDLPLLFKDRFTTIATAGVTFMLLETGKGKLVDSGSVGGEAKISGKVGSDFSITAKTVGAS
jgi:hypothetical protein